MLYKPYRSLILILLAAVLLAGCGRTARKADNEAVAVSQAAPEKKAEEPEKKDVPPPEEKMPDKNMGVITDTVVDVFRDADVQSERVTQAIFNQPVTLLEEKETWVKVNVADGYTGWIKSKHVDRDLWSIHAREYQSRLIITAKTKKITSQARGGGTLKEVVLGTELYIVMKLENWYQVALPGKMTGWVNDSGTIILPADEKVPQTTAEDLVATANKFKGTVYLWGGVSPLGVDCSGLTYICSRINGITLPRDADQQYNFITAKVEKNVDLMKAGDFVFFSTKEDLKDVSHMGVYIGNGQFIHASKSKGSVTTNSLGEDYFKNRLVGVRRVFDK